MIVTKNITSSSLQYFQNLPWRVVCPYGKPLIYILQILATNAIKGKSNQKEILLRGKKSAKTAQEYYMD